MGSYTNTGSGTRTLNMGNGVWTITGTGNCWLQNGATNLTFNCNSSTLSFTGTSTTLIRTITLGAFTYNIVSFAGSAAGTAMSGAHTIATWNISAPNTISLNTATYTVTNALTLTGSPGSPIAFLGGTFNNTATIALGAASTGTWCAIRDITFTTNSMTLTNSLDLGKNGFSAGGSISPPSSSSGSSFFGVMGS